MNIRGGALADYKVRFREEMLGDVGEASTLLRAYPRWSATVWDLVARSISVALNGGNEQLPARPQLAEVPVHESSGFQYVRFRELSEPTRAFFSRKMASSTRRAVENDYSRNSDRVHAATTQPWLDVSRRACAPA